MTLSEHIDWVGWGICTISTRAWPSTNYCPEGPTALLCTRRAAADYTSWEISNFSMCATRCWRFSSLSGLVPSSPLFTAGEATSQPLTPANWTNWSRKLALPLLPTSEVVVERRKMIKVMSIMENQDHPLHHTMDRQWSIFSKRLRQLCCLKKHFRRSLVPRALALFTPLWRIIRYWTFSWTKQYTCGKNPTYTRLFCVYICHVLILHLGC